MNSEETKKLIKEKVEKLKPKHYRAKLVLSLIILLTVAGGLYWRFFETLGIFDFTSSRPQQAQLDETLLARLGFDTTAFEQDVDRLVRNMNNAQQGTHFLLGMISGLVFSQPTAGFTVGLIKEAYDFIQNYRGGHINTGYVVDAAVDTSFWLAGGFVGFYFLSALYDIFREQGIRNPKDIFLYIGKKVSLRRRNKK